MGKTNNLVLLYLFIFGGFLYSQSIEVFAAPAAIKKEVPKEKTLSEILGEDKSEITFVADNREQFAKWPNTGSLDGWDTGSGIKLNLISGAYGMISLPFRFSKENENVAEVTICGVDGTRPSVERDFWISETAGGNPLNSNAIVKTDAGCASLYVSPRLFKNLGRFSVIRPAKTYFVNIRQSQFEPFSLGMRKK